VSQHLKALLDSNLVSVSASGTKRIYAINKPGFDRVNLWLDQFWS
jgi:DNA-binding transcriptional ArsR family regulator